MNANQAHTLDSFFGPPSGVIKASDFIQSATPQNNHATYDQQVASEDVTSQCRKRSLLSVDDIRDASQETWSNPTLSAYLMKDHDHTVTALHMLNQKAAKSSRKAHLSDPDSLGADVISLQKALDSVTLRSFSLNTDSVIFMRTPKNSDQNILRKAKISVNVNKAPEDLDAILIVSIHNKVFWGPSYVTRASQHIFLASQTLKDVYTALPCISHELPLRSGVLDQIGCAICIEGLIYGDGRAGGSDYAEKVIKQLELSNKKNSKTITKAPTSLHNTELSSLSLRINEPYWLIHHGNCEHFLVVDQIRLMHPMDPPTGYPLTLQITPPILDLCRACAKAPAVWSVVGDIRLGESPCLLCGPCWRNMGSSNDKEVAVLRLPEYTVYT